MPKFNLESQMKKALEFLTSDLLDYKNLKKLDPKSEDYSHYSQIKHLPTIMLRFYPKDFISDWIKNEFKIELDKEFGIVDINKKFKSADELSHSLTQYMLELLALSLEENEMHEEKEWLLSNLIGANLVFIGLKHKPKLVLFLREVVEENYEMLENTIYEGQDFLEMNIDYFTEEDRVFQSLSAQQIRLPDDILKKVLES